MEQQIQQQISKPEGLSLDRFHLILTLIPIIEMILFWALVLRARLFVGHWPYYNHPDPKFMGADLHYTLCILGVPITMASFLMMLVFVVFKKKLLFKDHFYFKTTFYFITFAIWFTTLKMDVGGLAGWLAD